LVHGSGAGRLAYDLHAAGDAPLTVATDFNPMLLFVAREMYAGRELELYEFPIAPRRMEDHAVLRRLRSPGPARPGLDLVAADALQPPFADGAFDTVVTPWFIDIIGEPFARVAARVNLALKPGGRWIIPFAGIPTRRAPSGGLEEVPGCSPRRFRAAPTVREARCPYALAGQPPFARGTVVSWVTNKVAQPGRARPCRRLAAAARAAVPRTRYRDAGNFQPRSRSLALINGEGRCATWRRCWWIRADVGR
jgi:hypothetical protein